VRVVLRNESAQKPDLKAWSRPGEEYVVLAIGGAGGASQFRILGPQGSPALFEASDFEITDPAVDPSWIVRRDASGSVELLPAEWARPGFWVDYFDDEPAAVADFRRAVRRMMPEIPDAPNVDGTIETDLPNGQVAALFAAEGWTVGRIAFEDYELDCKFARLVIESSRPTRIRGAVADLVENALRIADMLRRAGLRFTLECYSPGGETLTTLTG
jgi:hypothetical protein